MWHVVVAALAGAGLAAVLSCIPGLHIYNIMALVVILAHHRAGLGAPLPPDVLVPLLVSMTVAYSLASTIPSVLLAAPDESALFTVLPGQKYLMQGRGHEGVMITAAGGLAALVVVVLGFGLLAPRVLPLASTVLRPHTHWILWTVIGFLLMSEWPKGGRLRSGGWRTFLDGWKTTGAGLLTFLLAGLLGFILLYRSPVDPAVAFQNLMPAFVGLFTLPALLLNLAGNVEVPQQAVRGTVGLDRYRLLQGTFAGVLGGGFAAFFPVITGGVGGLLAGHAAAIRDDRVFLVSQGASKTTYYVGAFLLFFLPGLHLTRGGSAWMLGGLYAPRTPGDYEMALAAVGIAGACTLLLLGPLTRAMLWLLARAGCRAVSWAALLGCVGLVLGITGVMGLFIMLVATGIGLLPVLCGSRRMNGLGVILLPMACNMSDVGAPIAGWLGLLG